MYTSTASSPGRTSQSASSAMARGGAGGSEAEAAGEAWFDHEWSTSALGAGAVGWDWFSLQLDDGRELMHFQIRREDGSIEPGAGRTGPPRGCGTNSSPVHPAPR